MGPESIKLEEIDRKGHILYSICVEAKAFTTFLDLCAISSVTSHFNIDSIFQGSFTSNITNSARPICMYPFYRHGRTRCSPALYWCEAELEAFEANFSVVWPKTLYLTFLKCKIKMIMSGS